MIFQYICFRDLFEYIHTHTRQEFTFCTHFGQFYIVIQSKNKESISNRKSKPKLILMEVKVILEVGEEG